MFESNQINRICIFIVSTEFQNIYLKSFESDKKFNKASQAPALKPTVCYLPRFSLDYISCLLAAILAISSA